jgi:serine protease Do
MNRLHGKPKSRIVVLCVLLVGVIGLAGFGSYVFAQNDAKTQGDSSDLAAAQAMSKAFRVIAAKAKPGVVSVYVRAIPKKTESQREMQGIDPDNLPEPLREFFRDRKGWPFDRRFFEPKQPTPRAGVGSGVIIDASNGYILTNNHVVEAAAESEDSRINVTLSDGRKVPAKIVGRDPATDLALLQVKAEGIKLHELPLGDSDKIEVGEIVLAIGAPFSLNQTVTQGIVSATGRNPGIVQGYEDFIQTDAAINPGNSGGPLLNLQGEVVGINTAIVTNGMSPGFMGIGFAVPSATLRELLPLWKEGKEIVRGYLGVGIKSLKEAFEPGIGKTYGLDEDKGILIEEIKPGTPASKSGLKAEDIILAYNGEEVTSVRDLQMRVARTKPDTTVDIKVWRDRKEITVPVKIEKQPKDYFTRDWREQGEGPGGGDEAETEIETLGMTVAPVTPELAKSHGWENEKDLEGAHFIVTAVEPLGEAAANLGIHEGDLILTIQGRAIKSGNELREALSRSALAEGVRLRIRDVQYKHMRTLFARMAGEN